MYVVYCQNKPKSEHVVSEFGDSYFEVSGRGTWGDQAGILGLFWLHNHWSLSPGAPAAARAPPAAQRPPHQTSAEDHEVPAVAQGRSHLFPGGSAGWHTPFLIHRPRVPKTPPPPPQTSWASSPVSSGEDVRVSEGVLNTSLSISFLHLRIFSNIIVELAWTRKS